MKAAKEQANTGFKKRILEALRAIFVKVLICSCEDDGFGMALVLGGGVRAWVSDLVKVGILGSGYGCFRVWG